MKVTVVGGGPVGLAYCAILQEAGHDVRLWSQSLADTAPRDIRFGGKLDASHRITPVPDASAAAAFGEVLLLARQGLGTRAAIDALVPHLRPDQVVIFSAELSFAALYLARRLAQAGRSARSISWSTTVATAQRKPDEIRVGTLRDVIDIAGTGFDTPDAARAICTALFGDRFRDQGDPVRIGLSNLNPQIHLANSIANLTRIERAEVWENYECITPVVGRLIEALDQERLALAAALGHAVRTVHEHYLMTFPGLRPGTVSEMAYQVFERAPGTLGPTRLDTRYLTEDIPFGLLPLCEIARAMGRPLVLHEAGISLVQACLGREFRADNDMLDDVLAALKPELSPAG